jgi:hypothetical protein
VRLGDLVGALNNLVAALPDSKELEVVLHQPDPNSSMDTYMVLADVFAAELTQHTDEGPSGGPTVVLLLSGSPRDSTTGPAPSGPDPN